jgi:hypothetical protein
VTDALDASAETPDALDEALSPEQVEAHQHRAHKVGHVVYGGIIAVTLIAAADDAADSIDLLRILVATGVVLWLAHSFAAAMGHAISRHQHLHPDSVRACMVENSALLLGFLIPLPAIAIGLFHSVDDARAADAAIVISLVALFGIGIVLGRQARMRWHAATVSALVYPLLGGAVIALEVAVAH